MEDILTENVTSLLYKLRTNIQYEKYHYPSTHFAYTIETISDPNFILAVRGWDDTGTYLDAIAILVHEDWRGWRVIIKLVDRTDPTRAWNRVWTRTESRLVMDLAELVYQSMLEFGLTPQLRKDGCLASKSIGSKLVYGTESEPHRLFTHIIGRNPRNLKIPFQDPGRRFTLAGEFAPWPSISLMHTVAVLFRKYMQPKLFTYGLIDYELVSQASLLKTIPKIQWVKNNSTEFFTVNHMSDESIQVESHNYFPYILMSKSDQPQPKAISKEAFFSVE